MIKNFFYQAYQALQFWLLFLSPLRKQIMLKLILSSRPAPANHGWNVATIEQRY
jgi:hypothetical protein